MANEFVVRKGLISSGSINVSGSVTASIFNGNGSQLTNINSASFATTASAATSITFTPSTASFASTASNLNGGTTNYIPLWTSATAQSSSAIYQSSGNVGIGTTSPRTRLDISGTTSVQAIFETTTTSATAATGTINFDVNSQAILYYTLNATGNWTLNVRGNSTTSLDSILATGQNTTIVFMATNGSPAYYQTGFQIDGSAVTIKWLDATAPTSGNTSSIDVYTFSILKTAANTYTVLGSRTKFG